MQTKIFPIESTLLYWTCELCKMQETRWSNQLNGRNVWKVFIFFFYGVELSNVPTRDHHLYSEGLLELDYNRNAISLNSRISRRRLGYGSKLGIYEESHVLRTRHTILRTNEDRLECLWCFEDFKCFLANDPCTVPRLVIRVDSFIDKLDCLFSVFSFTPLSPSLNW